MQVKNAPSGRQTVTTAIRASGILITVLSASPILPSTPGYASNPVEELFLNIYHAVAFPTQHRKVKINESK